MHVCVHLDLYTVVCGYGLSNGPTEGLSSWWSRNRSSPTANINNLPHLLLFPHVYFQSVSPTRPEFVFAQRHHHHRSSVVHGCKLSATELFRSPLLVSGTNYHATSRLHRPYRVVCQTYENSPFRPFLSRLSVVLANRSLQLLSDTLIDRE